MSYGGNDRGPTLNVVTWVFTALSIVFTGLRAISRTVLTKNYGVDDALILFSLLVTIAYAASSSAAIDAGFGKHFLDIPVEDRPLAGYRTVILSMIAVWTTSLPKLAIVALLQRLLTMSLTISIIFWFLAISLTGCSCVLSVFWYAQCTPREHQWDRSVPGTCWSPLRLQDLSYFTVAFSALIDFIFAAYPIFAVARLNMALHKRIVISMALSGGFVAGAVAIYKEALVSGISESLEKDPTYADVPLAVWNVVEANVLILVANLPTIGPFVRFVSSKATKLYTGDNTTPSKRHIRTTETNWPGERSTRRWKVWTAGTNGTTRLPSQQDDIYLVDAESRYGVGVGGGGGGATGHDENNSAHAQTKDSPHARHDEIQRFDPELGITQGLDSPREETHWR